MFAATELVTCSIIAQLGPHTLALRSGAVVWCFCGARMENLVACIVGVEGLSHALQWNPVKVCAFTRFCLCAFTFSGLVACCPECHASSFASLLCAGQHVTAADACVESSLRSGVALAPENLCRCACRETCCKCFTGARNTAALKLITARRMLEKEH